MILNIIKCHIFTWERQAWQNMLIIPACREQLGDQGHPQLLGQFKTNLGYMSPCQETLKFKPKQVKERASTACLDVCFCMKHICIWYILYLRYRFYRAKYEFVKIKYTSFYYILQFCIYMYDVLRTFLCLCMNVEARGKYLGTGSLFPLVGPKDRAQVFRLVSRPLDALSRFSET